MITNAKFDDFAYFNRLVVVNFRHIPIITCVLNLGFLNLQGL